MYKTMIAPIVAVIAIAAQLIFGVDISEEVQSQLVEWIANGILIGTAIYGVVKNHKKDGEK